MSTVLSQGRFLGRTLWQKRFGDLNLTLTRYGATERLPLHHHRQPYLCLVLGGGFQESSESVEQECQFGTVILNTSGSPHQDSFSAEGARCLNVDLDSSFLQTMPMRDLTGPVYARTTESCAKAHRVSVELEQFDNLSAYAIQGVLLSMLVETARGAEKSESQIPPWLEAVRAELHLRFADPLTLRDLALMVDVHPSHLARTFRSHFDTTIGGYLRRLRAEKAHELLCGSNAPLATIAVECGFYDQSHLTRAIREFYETTPVSIRAASSRRNARPMAQC